MMHVTGLPSVHAHARAPATAPSCSSNAAGSLQRPVTRLPALRGAIQRQQRGCSFGRSSRLQGVSCNSTEKDGAGAESPAVEPTVSVQSIDLDKEVSNFAKKTASTFAPRASGKQNPAYKGSTLYAVFEWQAYISVVVGGLLSFNIIFPTDGPDIARLMGMWSLWMFTVPSLRARDCDPAEKDALNLLFLALPLINVTLPFLWKSFPFIYTCDVLALVGVYAWKIWLPAANEEKA